VPRHETHRVACLEWRYWD